MGSVKAIWNHRNYTSMVVVDGETDLSEEGSSRFVYEGLSMERFQDNALCSLMSVPGRGVAL